MTKSAFASIVGKKAGFKGELPPNARFEKTKRVVRLLVPVIVSILWSLSNIASYHMGKRAGRTEEIALSTVNAVAKQYYEQGLSEGYFKGLSKSTNVETYKGY